MKHNNNNNNTLINNNEWQLARQLVSRVQRERERERRSSHVVVGAHFVHFQLNWSCGVVPTHCLFIDNTFR